MIAYQSCDVTSHKLTSAVKSKNVLLTIVSKGMGHSFKVATQIYLTISGNSMKDKANGIVL